MTTKIERVPSFFESISKEVFRNQKENEEVQLLIPDMKWRHRAIIRTPGVANTCWRSLKGSHKLMRDNLSTVLANDYLHFRITEKTLPKCNNFTCTGIYHITYPFNRTITFKLPLDPLLRRLIVLQQWQSQLSWCSKDNLPSHFYEYRLRNVPMISSKVTYKSSNKECFVWVSSSIGITLWVICIKPNQNNDVNTSIILKELG